jgi:hypothetical protein
VYARGAHPIDDADGTYKLAFQRTGLVDLLLEVGGGKSVAAVEDFVSN